VERKILITKTAFRTCGQKPARDNRPRRRIAGKRFPHGGGNPFGPAMRIPAGKTILLARRREHPRLVPAE